MKIINDLRNNRANARKEGRLVPSVLHKVNTHISINAG